MFALKNWQGAAVMLACWGLMIPQVCVMADAQTTTSVSPQTQKSADIALTKEGVLVGAAFSPDGRHLDGAQVVITQSGKEVVRTNTDKNGAFAVAQLKSGAYQIGIGDKVAPIRVWTAETAPPKALQKAVLVTGKVVRGQGPTLGLDIITLTTVAAATTAGVVSIINLNQVNNIEDQLDQITSP